MTLAAVAKCLQAATWLVARGNKDICPTLEEIGEFIRNPVFQEFCWAVKEKYRCSEKIEFSACSMESGWNVKFKKSGKALCTIYPRESYFTVMLVIGKKEKQLFESILPDCTPQLKEVYERTKEGDGQRWLMVDLEDADDLYRDVFRVMEIRAAK